MTTTRLAIVVTATARTDGVFCARECQYLSIGVLKSHARRCSKFPSPEGLTTVGGVGTFRDDRCTLAEQRAKEMGL